METGKSGFHSRLGGQPGKLIKHLNVCPGYTDKIHAHFCPVILLDAAHL